MDSFYQADLLYLLDNLRDETENVLITLNRGEVEELLPVIDKIILFVEKGC